MDVTAYVLADLAIILVALRVGSLAAAVVRLPPVVGEIVAGILIGPTVLGGQVGIGGADGSGLAGRLYPPDAFAFLSLTAQVGLVLYMFLVGFELDGRLLEGRRASVCAVAVAAAAAPVAVAVAAAPAFAGSTWRPPGVGDLAFALVLGAGLGATALPVMARMLEDKGMIGHPVAAMGIGVAGIVTVVVFLVIAAAEASRRGEDVAADVAVRVAWTIGLVLVLRAVARPAMAWVLSRIDVRERLGTVLTTLLALALATGLAADRIGIHSLVGGFLFGLAVPASEELRVVVRERVRDMIVLVLLPVFFAVSGLMTDFRQLAPAALPGVALFLVLSVAGKWGPGYLAGRASGLGGRDANALGVLLSCGGLLVLVVGLRGLELGVITPELQAAFVVAAVATLVAAGPLLDLYTTLDDAPP